MASLKEPVCRKEDYLLIDIGTLYRVISSFSYSDAEKFQFIESVWKPDLLFEFPASKETSRKQRKFRGTQRAFFTKDDIQLTKVIIQPSLCFFCYFSLLLGKNICSALPARRLYQFQLPARQGGQFPASQHCEIVSQPATKKANNWTQASSFSCSRQ